MRLLSGPEMLAGVLVALVYAMLTPAMYYLGARATITRFMWSRYPAWLDYYTYCAACIGVLYGVIVAMGIGWYLDAPFLFLPGRFWMTPLVVGLLSLWWTPMLAAPHLAALETTSPSHTLPEAEIPSSGPLNDPLSKPPVPPLHGPMGDDSAGPNFSGQPGAFAKSNVPLPLPAPEPSAPARAGGSEPDKG